ncbi:RNA polymerase sigma-I factor [Lysinibacillus yapensis]|uniref:RNA polymerase sigma factor SigI n=1 Tax=Ureibacillus yapensis TaxID=2304605 RepID=A0A396S6D5_9BACL|nr:RNA polymerase sigma-I factor [Lysinibacillus yapensis]RHW35852.1 RNA polymerase sigma-I factor [Lysinibacillus yapensis]
MLLSIIHGLFEKQNMNQLVLKAKAGNEEVLNDLLFAGTPFIKRTASFVCKRPIDEHDEEFSVAMSGFYEAVIAFNVKEAASFQTFAHLIIKRRLIDYLRRETTLKERHMLLEPANDESSDQHFIFDKQSIHTYNEKQRATSRKDELIHYKNLLAEFNLTFEQLTKSSPKHADSRKTAFQIAQLIADTEELYTYLIKNKKLPSKDIEALVEVSRKTVERHRKYIISVVLLLKSDFHYIKDYVKGVMQ